MRYIKHYFSDILSLFVDNPLFWIVFLGSGAIAAVGIAGGPYAEQAGLPIILIIIAVMVVICFWSFCFMLIYPFLKN